MSYTEMNEPESPWRKMLECFVAVVCLVLLAIYCILMVGTIKAHADCSTPSCMNESSIRPVRRDEPRVMPVEVDRHVLDESDYRQDPSVLIATAKARAPMAMPAPEKIDPMFQPKSVSTQYKKQEMVVTSVVDDGKIEY